MWPDNETTDDLIGFQVHSDLIREVVTNPAMLPLTIGVFGDWGGGKTSIMKMLERDLDPEHWPDNSEERKKYENVAVVYVDTWLFEGYDDAKAALLSSVILELAEHKRFGAKVRDAAVSLLKRVDLMRGARMLMKHVALPAVAAFFSGGLSAVPAAVALSTGVAGHSSGADTGKQETSSEKEKVSGDGLFKKDTFQAQMMDVRTFRKRFGKMLDDGGITTLVVLVDDLDRCTPERIIENLEALKLFLSVKQTAFVIGADRRIVEHAIRSRYAEHAIDTANDEQRERLVKDYLEKLVQLPYSLPRLSATEIETYMTLLFCEQYLKAEKFSICLNACEASRAKNRYAGFGYASVREALQSAELDSSLTEALTLSAAAAPLIAEGLKGNPRQVKRFLNALLLRKELARVAKLENIRDGVLVKLMILEYAHTELFTQLFTWQAQQDGHPKEIAQLEDCLAGREGDVNNEDAAKKIDAKWATMSMRRWVAMEPLLNDVDLRDYFWVARDRLESTFTGISMVPPIVRNVLDGLLSDLAPKRNSAMEAARKLTEDERASLLTLVDQLISRQPEDKTGYRAILYLIEADVTGAAELLANTLSQRPLEKVPPNVGMDFMTLYKAKTKLRSILDVAKDRLLESKTRIGKAAQSAMQVKE
ncbi:MAG: P-loop NTPase fold protein [Syntrophobacteraceae bacterium]